VCVGALLFVVTLSYLDVDETLEYVRRLGLALPVVLLPSAVWHGLRTWGWWVAFPEGRRPPFTRLARVRLAADAVSFFTVRGLTGDPLKVLLLYDRTPAAVTASAVAAERLAFAIVATVVAGLASQFAVRRLSLPFAWDATFTALSIGAVIVVGGFALIARHRTGHYLARFVGWLDRVTGRTLETSRAIRFILEVEAMLLDVLRGDRRRLLLLTALPVICYAVNTFEVWLVFWVVGEPISATAAVTIETFVRAASIATAMVPASLGTLEASHAAVVVALGLSGGSALVLTRRVRSLLWAAVGLACYPRIGPRAASRV
jgi:uncharacterized protein (TIRG00374 family)